VDLLKLIRQDAAVRKAIAEVESSLRAGKLGIIMQERVTHAGADLLNR
jgi:hypothetical protein